MFYLFLKIIIGAAVRIFFRKIRIKGAEYLSPDYPIILVSNHPSAFMDPLVLGVLLKKPLYFFARADIFTSAFVKWITKKAHVSPIYRIVDGAGSLEKNDAVFLSAYQLLYRKKMLLLFGEGFTDEVFIRRVKPMKKGSMRIALGAENNAGFKLNVKIICAGINYSDPGKFRSDLIIRFSKPISAGKYKDLFLEHNNKAMQELNKEIYSRLKEETIHIENAENAELLEQLLILSRKGMNNDFFDSSLSLEERWAFSKRLADKINSLNNDSELLETLSKKCKEYFNALEKTGITDKFMNEKESSRMFLKTIYLILFFPVFLIGVLANYPPLKFSTLLSKMISKRPVFWSSTNMAFSAITVPLYYCLLFFLICHFVNVSAFLLAILTVILLLVLPAAGIFSFRYMQQFVSMKEKIKFKHTFSKNRRKMEELSLLRKSILEKMEEIL